MTAFLFAGTTDPVSLFARFSYTEAEVREAGGKWATEQACGRQAPKEKPWATYVHELTHYLQYTTTPYGLFLHYCRQLQNEATIELIRGSECKAIGHEARLAHLPPSHWGSASKRANEAWAAWWCLENFIAVLSTDRERRIAIQRMFGADPRTKGTTANPVLLDLPRTFDHIQWLMAEFLRRHLDTVSVDAVVGAITGHRPQEDLSVIFYSGAAKSNLWMDLVSDPSAADLSAASEQWERDVNSYPYSAEAIIESAALAAELWESDTTLERLKNWLAKPANSSQEVYRSCLRRTLAAIRTEDISALLLSHMVICEIVLLSPLLPSHVHLRGKGFPFAENLPAWRFDQLLTAAVEVPVMRDRRDYGRYVSELCTRARLSFDPLSLCRNDANGPYYSAFPISRIYREAQRFRDAVPSSMLGVDRYFVRQGPVFSEWRENFNFTVIDYADKTTYHRNKDLMGAMTDRYLETLALRKLMMDPSPQIASPYGRKAGEDEYCTKYIRAYLAAKLPGVALPEFEVVPLSRVGTGEIDST